MAEPDIAYNTRLYGYMVGEVQNRTQQLVIRIRRVEGGGRNTSRATRGTLDATASDDSGAGHSFGSEELQFTEVLKDELVIVVGQLLAKDGLSHDEVHNFETPSKGRKSAGVADFNPEVHHVIDTQLGKHIVVCKLFGDRMKLYVLVRKEDGLCEIAPLPLLHTFDTRLVYYSEWTDSPAKRAHRDRKSDWKKNIAEFWDWYIKENASKIIDSDNSPEAERPVTADAPRDPVRLGSPAGLRLKLVLGLTDRASLVIKVVQNFQDLLQPIVQRMNDTMDEERAGLGGGSTAESKVEKLRRALEQEKSRIETIISASDEPVSGVSQMARDGQDNANDADEQEETGDEKEREEDRVEERDGVEEKDGGEEDTGVEEEDGVEEDKGVEENKGVGKDKGVEEDEEEWGGFSSSSEDVKENKGVEGDEEEWGDFSSSAEIESERPRKKVKIEDDRVRRAGRRQELHRGRRINAKRAAEHPRSIRS